MLKLTRQQRSNCTPSCHKAHQCPRLVLSKHFIPPSASTSNICTFRKCGLNKGAILTSRCVECPFLCPLRRSPCPQPQHAGLPRITRDLAESSPTPMVSTNRSTGQTSLQLLTDCWWPQRHFTPHRKAFLHCKNDFPHRILQLFSNFLSLLKQRTRAYCSLSALNGARIKPNSPK